MNFDLLRQAALDDLNVGDKLYCCSGMKPTIAYKAPNFVVLRFEDGSEGIRDRFKLAKNFRLQPLCWVEDKPVYPGDGPLYYKYNPEWKFNDKGVVVSSVRDDELLFHGGMAFPIADATWTKPKLKRVPSFQVEGIDVYPGDTVYYYGENEECWGSPHTVKENARVVHQSTGCNDHVDCFANGAASFRLKLMLVIGDHLVPMPVREPMKEGETYFIPSLYNPEAVGVNTWRDTTYDRRCLSAGLIHYTGKAAVAHGEALRALSKKKKD